MAADGDASLLLDTPFSAFTEDPWRQIAAATEKYVALFTVAAAFRVAVALGGFRRLYTSPVSPATFSAR